MNKKTNIKLNLSGAERKRLRQNKIRKSDIIGLSIIELQEVLQVEAIRAREIYALADFQRIPTIGIRFAEDLLFLGYYAVCELQGKDGAKLTDEYEKKKGYKTDVCVEDQFRLAVYYADTYDDTKRWWDFTDARKRYRTECGYPEDRPELNWTDVLLDGSI